jgi:hypothetical protein
VTEIELAQIDYLAALARTRDAGIEHARARMELVEGERLCAGTDLDVIALRNALATKRWEFCLREEATSLESYNSILLREVQRSRPQVNGIEISAATEGHRFCFTSTNDRD